MGRKLVRDAASWLQRVKMGRTRAWAVVEGKDFDTPFYEALLSQAAPDAMVEIVLAELISVDGKTAGGKSHVRKLYELASQRDALRQSNKFTTVDVIFFMDSDDDRFGENLIEDAHVFYTEHADVEAEIIAHADLDRALPMIFGLPSQLIRKLDISHPEISLAQIWRDWIVLRLAASRCAWGDQRFAQRSTVNVDKYGAVEPSLIEAICARPAQMIDGWSEYLTAADAYVKNAEESGSQGQLVKGKWLPHYLSWLVQKGTTPRPLPPATDRNVIGVCLATVDFEADWAAPYTERLRDLINA